MIWGDKLINQFQTLSITKSTPKVDSVRGSSVISAENPYIKIPLDDCARPSENELLQASSILTALPHLRSKSFAAEIAYDEFCYFMSQTYFFELLGFQVLSSMSLSANKFDFLHEVAAQSVDEARHIEAYRTVIEHIGSISSVSPCIPGIFTKITSTASLPEKAVKGFLVLESLAVGLFGARISSFAQSSIAVLDRQIIAEEVNHQQHAVQVVSEFINDGIITLDEVIEIMREGVNELALEIVPFEVAEKHSLDLGNSTAKELLKGGILLRSSMISRSNIRQNLKTLRKLTGGQKWHV